MKRIQLTGLFLREDYLGKEVKKYYVLLCMLLTVVIGILIVRFWLQIPPILEHGFLFESEFVIWKWVVGISSFSFLIHPKFVC